MAQIDALAEFLVEQDGYELVLPGDDNCCISDFEGTHVLNRVLRDEEVAALLLEVMPPELRAAWEAKEPVHFVRRTEAGEFRVGGEHTADGVRATIARMPSQYVETLLCRARDAGASDLLLAEGAPAFVRRGGGPERLTDRVAVPAGALAAFLDDVAPMGAERDPSGAFLAEVGDAGRVRCACLPGAEGPALSLRLLPDGVPAPEGLPVGLRDALLQRAGLILVATAPAQGLTWLLAGILRQVDADAPVQVVTIERLPEIPSPAHAGLLTRYVLSPWENRAEALQAAAALRPDVVFVDELSDEPALAAALDVAETGCLVVAGCRGGLAAEALAGLLERVDADARAEVRQRLARTVRGVVAQVLARAGDGSRVPVREVLVVTEAAAEAIRRGHLEDLADGLRAVGFSRDDVLRRWVAEGRLSLEEAAHHASNPRRFREESAQRA